MIKIDESMTRSEFHELIKGHKCKLVYSNGTEIYINPGDSAYNWEAVEYMQILDQKPQSIGDKAKEVVYGDREQTYGDPGVNIRAIADYWSIYTGVQVLPEDVCNMMCLLKIARLCHTPGHEDSMIDLIGYTL